jgi:hypothetical protein
MSGTIMTRRNLLKAMGVGAAALAPPSFVRAKASGGAGDLPNIVNIYADDLGYGDLSCYNPKAAYKTPRLDQMAKEGGRSAPKNRKPIGMGNIPSVK